MTKATPTPSSPGGVLTVTNPSTGEPVGEIQVSTPVEVAEAVSLSRSSQTLWSALTAGQRGRMLVNFRDGLLAAKDEIAAIWAAETGLPQDSAYEGEILHLCETIGWWSANGPGFLADERAKTSLLSTRRAYTVFRPRGVVGFLVPRASPLSASIGEAIPALIAGNGAVVKPSKHTPLTAATACRIGREAGLPDGLLACVYGGAEVGDQLIAAADCVRFRGRPKPARRIAAQCAADLTPLNLDVLGDGVSILRIDANVKAAAQAIVAGCVEICRREGPRHDGSEENAARNAAYIENVYAHPYVHDRYLAALRSEPGVQSGEVRVVSLAEEEADASTEISDPEDNATVTVLVTKVENDVEAFMRANASGLVPNAAVWSRNRSTGLDLARRIQAKRVCINEHAGSLALPTGAFGGTSADCEYGAEDIRAYTIRQSLLISRFSARPGKTGPLRITRRTLDLIFRSSWRGKLGR